MAVFLTSRVVASATGANRETPDFNRASLSDTAAVVGALFEERLSEPRVTGASSMCRLARRLCGYRIREVVTLKFSDILPQLCVE